MVRTPSCDKSGMRKGTWTPEEDKKLIAYVTRYGCWNWRQLPRFAGLARCGKSCRLRWMNYLRPNIKRGNFTQEEEECIIRMHKVLGNKWSIIAAELPGRTDNEIKNHWHTSLKKRFQTQNTVTNERTKASKSKDKESKKGKDFVVPNNDVITNFQVTPIATSLISDNSGSLSSPASSSSEFSSITSDVHSSASSNQNLVFEDEFGFLDANTEPMSDNFWSELFLDDISFNTTNEIVSGNAHGALQDATKALESCALSPIQTTSDNLVLENDDFGGFLDAYMEPIATDNFWTQPFVADMSHVPSDLLVPSVAESENFSTVYDDLWGQSNLYD
ncbi:hypothetical protein RJT34_31184 [Clitoria ternatea]|uniref:Uncharacterized protein n=1 Tax=Clitoria ternatea TaxID=43366 RepID=A0AAN9EU72_CLITE